MEKIIGTHRSSGEEEANLGKTSSQRYRDFHFKTTYYKDSAAKFYVSRTNTHFPLVLIGGIAYLFLQILLNSTIGPLTYLKIVLVAGALLAYYRKVRIRYQSILILYGIGIQLETGFLFGTSRNFIEKSKILSTVIYDKMTYMELVPCIGIVVKDEKSLILPFSEFRIPMKKNILIYNTFKMI
ncbi:GPI-GlcNAc transferase complex PIG-H component family protein [Cryptosporidium felis]|nr:GPI-GlcNAc transferase complex PIG-H component family protein [Cryptosporidium felis]